MTLGDGAGAERRRCRGVLAGAVAALAALALAGCGGPPPKFQFVANTDRSMVVKLPSTWTALDATKVRGTKSTADNWAAYYDAANRPSDAHAVWEAPADSLTDPVLRMLTVKLPAGTARQLTEDDLRDALVPASDKGVMRLAIQAKINVDPDIGFQMIDEKQVQNSRAQGLRLTYAYNFGHGITVREKVVLVDRKGSHLYAIEIACSMECFDSRKPQIDSVLDSFTVKPPG